MKCDTCGTNIKKPPSEVHDKNFCNHDCYAKFKSKKWTKQNNPRWKGGDDVLNCFLCSKEFTRKKYGKKKSKYCSMVCANKDELKPLRAEKHWNWKGGKDSRFMRKNSPRPKPEKCEVCGALGSSFKKGLQYDHDHITGKFRGWLCTNCNTSLGLVKESITTLKALIKYLSNQ